MALTKSRNRMIAGVARTPIDYNDAASDGVTDARAAILLATGSGYCYLSPGTYRIASSVTLTGTIHFAPGAVLMPAASVTVTISCIIIADRHQIFETGLGGVFVNRQGGPTVFAYPEWWDGTPNSTTSNQAPYLTQAAAFIASSQGGEVRLSAPYRINTNLTLAGVVRFAPGTVLLPASGVTITLTGEIVAGAWQIFELGLGGIVVNGAVRNQMVLPEWWGAVPNVAVNQSAKIQAAINFAGSNLRTVYLRNGMWRCDQTLTMSLPCGIVGDPGVPNLGIDGGSSVLDFSAAPSSSHGLVVQRTGQFIDGVVLRDIVIFRGAAPTPGASASHGLLVVAAAYSNFENVVVWNFDFSFGVGGGAAIPCMQCRFVGCRSRHAGTWHWNIWSAIDCVWDQCPCELGAATIGINIYEAVPATSPNALHFRDCLIILPSALDGMRISTGFWYTITGCVFEEHNNNGIVVNLTVQDTSLINVTVHDCWFNNTGVCFSSEGLGGNFRIANNRMEVQDTTKPAGIYIDSPSGGSTERDIVITGNTIKVAGAAATGILLSRTAGAMVHHNRVTMHTAGAAQPGITLLANTTQNMLDNNRIKTTNSNSNGILDSGTGNALSNNFKY